MPHAVPLSRSIASLTLTRSTIWFTAGLVVHRGPKGTLTPLRQTNTQRHKRKDAIATKEALRCGAACWVVRTTAPKMSSLRR